MGLHLKLGLYRIPVHLDRFHSIHRFNYNIKYKMFSLQLVIVAQHQVRNLSTISWREQATYRREDDDVCFVLDQYDS